MWKDQLKTKGPKDQLQPSKKRIRFTSFDLSWLTSIKWVVFFCFEGSQRSTTVLRASPPSFPQPLYTASGATREGGGKTHWNPQVSQKEEQHLGHDKFSCVHRGFKGVDLQRLESEWLEDYYITKRQLQHQNQDGFTHLDPLKHVKTKQNHLLKQKTILWVPWKISGQSGSRQVALQNLPKARRRLGLFDGVLTYSKHEIAIACCSNR